MRFEKTRIPGVTIMEPTSVADERGQFTRIFCAEEFAAQGLELPTSQSAISSNTHRGTLRGLHYIPEERGEAKLVRCVKGRIFDVAVDMRRASPAFGSHLAVELSAERHNALFLPRGVAHGFITLEDDCDVLYQFSEPHRPGLERGLRWNDPSIAINWPLSPTVISERDSVLPFLAALDD